MKEYIEIYIDCYPEDFEYKEHKVLSLCDREGNRNGNTYELRRFLNIQR